MIRPGIESFIKPSLPSFYGHFATFTYHRRQLVFLNTTRDLSDFK